ncbi:hypothetical protein V6N13_084425 [Hibiscus sabdariffa]|uniref:Uncharacterized protein n=1 Tax=Hibiscus sabdariffa TaxID=183260 RepID=A0ABR2T0Z9_9ROSI
MDASKKAMDDFDSLWFFNNVLTLTTPLQHLLHEEEEEEDTVGEETKPSDSMILAPRCPNCGEIAGVGVEQRRAVHAKPPERRKRGRRRRKRSKRNLDLGYYGSLDSSESSFSGETNGICYLEMPPLNDGFAMKEHLKSWAYAVACTVR